MQCGEVVKEKMSSGHLAGIASITVIVLAGGASSIYLDGSEHMGKDVEKLAEGILDDFTTYIKVEDVVGRYSGNGAERELKNLLILAKLISADELNLTNLKVGLNNGKELILINYSGKSISCKSSCLFSNAIWKNLEYSFGLITLEDSDNSIQIRKVANDGDRFFIAINLPYEFHVKSGDPLEIYILPHEGIGKTIDVHVPFSCSSNIVLLE